MPKLYWALQPLVVIASFLATLQGLPGGSVVMNPPANQEMQVQSLGREDPLEEDMAACSSILAWKIHGQRCVVVYSQWGCNESNTV